MKKWIALVAATMFAAVAQAGQGFESMNEAAVYALALSAKLSLYYEYGGVIAEEKGAFFVAPPETLYVGDGVRFDVDPADWPHPLVADYHTHPCLPYTHFPAYFSINDLKSNRERHSIGYMLDLCTGDVHRYDPTVDKVAPDAQTWLGPIIGHIPVPGIPLELKP